MSVANNKSTSITNADAVPAVTNDPMLVNGIMRRATGQINPAAADDDNSVHRFIRVPSCAILEKLYLYNEVVTGCTAMDFGLYYPKSKGSAVIDQDLFASAVDLTAAHGVTGPLDITLEATVANQGANFDKPLWSLAGLASDPGGHFDICGTGTTQGSGTGSIRLTAYFVLPG